MTFKELAIDQYFKKSLGRLTMDVICRKTGRRTYTWLSQGGQWMDSTVETVQIGVTPINPPETV